MTISYIGTAYHGFQVQSNALSVQSVFQLALDDILGEKSEIKGCSRTDSGVHANKYCISFKTDNPIKPERLALALNNKLPKDVRAVAARYVSKEFHARYSCRGKRYIYKIWNDRCMNPFYEDRALQFIPPIDEKALDADAKVFLGTHDFSAFCSVKGKKQDSVRTVKAASVTRDEKLVTFSVEADGFLYNMVRIMTGALLSAARGKLTPVDIYDIIEAGTRSNLCQTAPACGLYLDEVYYDE